MKSIFNLRSLVAAGIVLGATALGSVQSAEAGGYGYDNYGHGGYSYQPQYTWKTITTYTTVRKPYYDTITKYDHCGYAYQEQILRYEVVQVPVVKKIKVYY
ncbi:MAG: hypothetical protein KDA80_03100 [Planctomycetaceae bacterium]|nr:hypothetical protein [Planctomycetaceae bacterium]